MPSLCLLMSFNSVSFPPAWAGSQGAEFRWFIGCPLLIPCRMQSADTAGNNFHSYTFSSYVFSLWLPLSFFFHIPYLSFLWLYPSYLPTDSVGQRWPNEWPARPGMINHWALLEALMTNVENLIKHELDVTRTLFSHLLLAHRSSISLFFFMNLFYFFKFFYMDSAHWSSSPQARRLAFRHPFACCLDGTIQLMS